MRHVHQVFSIATLVLVMLAACKGGDSSSLIADTSQYRWIDSDGPTSLADTLLVHLDEAYRHGIDPGVFPIAEMRADVDSLRAVFETRRFGPEADTLMARMDSMYTCQLIRYSRMMRYGMVRPGEVFNHLLKDADHEYKSYRHLFDLPVEEPSDSFDNVVLTALDNGSLPEILMEIRPSSSHYLRVQKELLRAKEQGDSALVRLCRIALERGRWRYPRPDSGQFIWVNLPEFMLTAVDTERDSLIKMKICAGNQAHKSPLLMSRISQIEFNPYWVVPQSIIRNEIVPRHTGDSAYFARNNMTAISRENGLHVDPTTLSAQQLRSARYIIRQEKGAGNSLGRIIFRFPNRYSVYLHDTNNPSAFNRKVRAVSHGCVRVEKPLDLCVFLLGPKPSKRLVDRIRQSVDLPALNTTDSLPEIKATSPYTPTRVWIDYQTLYFDAQGTMHQCPDSYGYDAVIWEKLGEK